MEIIINPRVAFLLIFTGVMLLLITFRDTNYSAFKFGAMVICFLAGIAEFFILNGNVRVLRQNGVTLTVS